MLSTLKTRTLLMVAAVLLLATAATPAAAITQIFETRVTGGDNNDAEEDSLGAVNLGDAVLELGGLYRKTGLRFTNITIPKDAPITRAYIEFTTAGADAANTSFTMEAEAQDNPAGFTEAVFNISSRHFYSQTVSWPMTYPWATLNEVHQSSDVTALVQKLVSRSGWVSGNAMVFVVSSE